MRRYGYTLVEILVVIVVVSLLLGVIFEIMIMGNKSFSIGSAQQIIENQARQGLDSMVRELYETNGGRVVFSDADTTITFKLPVGTDEVSGDLIWGAEGVQDYKIRYTVDNNRLVRIVLDDLNNLVRQKVLAADVLSLKFSLNKVNPLDPNEWLTITLKTEKKAASGNILTHTVSSNVSFRN